jgi:DNA polymerase III epsilon subunit-like protein
MTMITPISFMNMKSDQPNINYRDRNLCFIDLEFTGLDLSIHEILSIACVLVDSKNLKILEEKEWKIKIKYPENIDPRAREVTDYDNHDWKNAVDLEDALNDLNKFANFSTLIGFNIAFDWSFLYRDFEKLKIKPKVDYHMLDIMTLAYLNFKEKKQPKNLSLRAVAQRLAISVSDKHGALTDARATYEIYKKLSKNIVFEKNEI